MKFFFLFIILEICFTYIPSDAVKYANKWSTKPNPKYRDYADSSDKNGKTMEQSNFVSQALFAGGQSFSGCRGKDQSGMLVYGKDLKNCLEKKEWIHTRKISDGVKAGYPVFLFETYTPMIIVGFEGDQINCCFHRDMENITKPKCELYKESQLDFYYRKKN